MSSKVHIIYCHPSKKSTTHAIKEAYVEGLEDKGIEYSITDLYGVNFKTDISEREYLRENNNKKYNLTKEIKKEHKRINNANKLTFIFPLFWMDAPAKLVGYFSRVFTKGFKYGVNDEDNGTMNVMDETNFIITTGSSFDDLKEDGKIDALKTIFVDDRLADKSKKFNMYFFSETSYEKDSELKNKKRYVKKARGIGRKTS